MTEGGIENMDVLSIEQLAFAQGIKPLCKKNNVLKSPL
jgi:hypothetical protein